MIIWKCPNPHCSINNILHEDNRLIIENNETSRKVYEAQCGNCLKRYKLILNVELRELKIEGNNI